MPLTQAEAGRLLEASTARTTYPATTTTRVQLCSSAPTSTAAGSAVSGQLQNTAWKPATLGSTTTIANDGAVTFTGMPATTVSHIDVYDTANAAIANANRKWYAQLTTSRTTAAGDTLTFADGQIVLGLGTT